MKAIACFAVHFGKEYLAYAIRGVQDAVDEVHVFYAPEPSYGYRVVGAVCPDSETELRHEAERFCNKPLFWHEVHGTRNEGEHKNLMITKARERGADLYFQMDADEVWDPEAAVASAETVYRRNCAGRWLCHFLHFWQSFNWIIEDQFRPIRIVDMRHPLHVDEYLSMDEQRAPIMHFGYAQSIQTMRYKHTCHSHSPELIKNWLDDAYLKWQPGDGGMHPTQPALWTPRPATAEEVALVQKNLSDHPYAKTDKIR